MAATNSANLLDDAFAEFVQLEMGRCRIPGISIAVVQQNETFYQAHGGFDLKDGVAQQKVTPETCFLTASTSKAFLGAAWAKTIYSDSNGKDGKTRIDMTTPLSEIIRDDFVLSDNSATALVTIEDTMCHRTGYPRHDLSVGRKDSKSIREVTRQLRHLPMMGPIRQKWEYNNVMFTAASHALATVHDKDIEEVMRELIWDPLGMTSTNVMSASTGYPSGKRDKIVVAVGYTWTGANFEEEGENKLETHRNLDSEAFAGYVVSSVKDYAKWIAELLNPGKVLSEEVVKDIFTPRAMVPRDRLAYLDTVHAYSLGWHVGTYKGEKIILHGGDLPGVGALILMLPDQKWGVTMLANATLSFVALEKIAFHLVDNFLQVPEEKRFDFDTDHNKKLDLWRNTVKRAREKYNSVTASPLLPNSRPLADYAGRYFHSGYGEIEFKLGNDGKELVSTLERAFSQSIRLEHISGEHFLGIFQMLYWAPIHSAKRVEFKIDSKGEVQQVGIAMEDAMSDTLFWFTRV